MRPRPQSVGVACRPGVKPVRKFLAECPGIDMGEREYWHNPRFTTDQADLREFLRALRRG